MKLKDQFPSRADIPPGRYDATVTDVGTPFTDYNGRRPCRNCYDEATHKAPGCDACNGTGKQPRKQMIWTFNVPVDGQMVEHREYVGASLWAGGPLKDGTPTSASKLHDWVAMLVGSRNPDDIAEYDPQAAAPIKVKIEIGLSQTGKAKVLKLWPASHIPASKPAPVTRPEEPEDDPEIPF